MAHLDVLGQALEITPEALREACAAAARAYPEEACGVLRGPVRPAHVVDRCQPAANVQGELHAADPARYPRTARTAYALPAREVLDLARADHESTSPVKVVFHSHPDGEANFSDEDRRVALAGGDEPAYPLQHLVLAVRKGVPIGARLYDFDRERHDFVLARELPLPMVAMPEVVPAVAGGSDGVRPAASSRELLDSLRERIPEVDVETLEREMRERDDLRVFDVRESDEFREGHIDQSTHLPRGFLELRVEGVESDRDRPIVAYCAGGLRSLFAAESLQRMGYRDVRSLKGGFKAWKDAGLGFVRPETLSESDRERYGRHLLIPEVGEEGQLKLRKARVLLVGAGGLGSPAAYYLAAAGVGTLGIIDFDVVDRSNLQRQILHTDEAVGTSKVESARKTLLGLNPGIDVVGFEERLSSENVDRIFEGFDLVIDGCDNFPTRYLVNDACVKHGITNVHGSIFRFDGQVTVFAPGVGPCYRCLYPEPPPPELAPSCAEAGVLGVLPGVVGLLEAVEAVKLILGVGESLVGRLLTYEALSATFREFKLRRNPDCAYCADGKPFPGYVDYEHFCSAK